MDVVRGGRIWRGCLAIYQFRPFLPRDQDVAFEGSLGGLSHRHQRRPILGWSRLARQRVYATAEVDRLISLDLRLQRAHLIDANRLRGPAGAEVVLRRILRS